MQMSEEFIAGFRSAVHQLGVEGDHRCRDWSEPYEYLMGILKSFEPQKPKEIGGFKIVVSESMSDGMIEFHHHDGRVDRMMLLTATKT